MNRLRAHLFEGADLSARCTFCELPADHWSHQAVDPDAVPREASGPVKRECGCRVAWKRETYVEGVSTFQRDTPYVQHVGDCARSWELRSALEKLVKASCLAGSWSISEYEYYKAVVADAKRYLGITTDV